MASALRSSVQFEQRIERVRAFRRAYKEAVEFADKYEVVGLGRSYLGAPPGKEAEFNAMLDRLGELSGAAVAAAGEVQVVERRSGKTYSPMMHWRDPFEYRGGMASRADVLDACDTIVGMLETKLAEAKASERTLAYKFGRVVSFPQRARDAAGPSPVAQGLAFWGSLVVEILGSLAAAALLAALGLLLKNLL